MFELIQQNKEWLFSGVGVAIAGALIAWILNKKSENNQVIIHYHKSNEHNSKTNKQQKNNTEIIQQKITQKEVSKSNGTINFETIKNTIEAAPPLQRDDVKKHFVGIKVEWDTYLLDARKDDLDFINLILTTSIKKRDNTLYCKVPLSEYKELGVLPENTKIHLHGKIEEADTWDIKLNDVKLFFYDANV